MILSGRDLSWYIETQKLVIQPSEAIQFQQNGFDCVLDSMEKQGNRFYLGATREYFELPDDIMAFVGLKSSWARRGYSLPLTIVDAGFKGNLTLEILTFGGRENGGCGPDPVGQRFAHLIFAKLSSPSVPYAGKYQGQSGITLAREDESK